VGRNNVNLAQDRVSVFAAVRQWRKEIDSRIVDDVHQLLLVGEKLFNRAVPAGEIGRCRLVGPEIVGERGPGVMVGPDVFQNVVLTDAQMFEQMPEGVRAVRQSGIDMRFRKTGDGVLEDHVRLAFGQHAGQLGS
jgi:hypothetical protein